MKNYGEKNYKITKLQNYKITKFLLISSLLLGCNSGNKAKEKTTTQNPPDRHVHTHDEIPTYPPNYSPSSSSLTPAELEAIRRHKQAEKERAELQAELKREKEEYNAQQKMEENLIEACKNGDLETLKSLLKNVVDINAIYHGKTLLEYACHNGNEPASLELLKRGANVFNYQMDNPLEDICRHSLLNVVKYLIEEKFKDDPKKQKKVAIEALKNAYWPEAKDLVSYVVNLDGIDFPTDVLNKAFYGAIRYSLGKDILEKIYDQGKGAIKVNSIVDGAICTPLKWAIFNRDFESVKFLLDKRADFRDKDKNGHDALWDACTSQYSSPEIVELLIDKGAEVNAKYGDNEETLLHVVRDIKILEKLIEKGADVNAKKGNKDTPLHSAICDCKPKLEVVKKLIEKGGDVNEAGYSEETSLRTAVLNNKWEILKYLLTECKDKIDWNKQKVKKDKGGEQSFREWFKSFDKGRCWEDFKVFLSKRNPSTTVKQLLNKASCP